MTMLGSLRSARRWTLGPASPRPWLHLAGSGDERSSLCHGRPVPSSAVVARQSRVASRLQWLATRLRFTALPLVLAAGALAVSRPIESELAQELVPSGSRWVCGRRRLHNCPGS